jgi:transcriptional regulator with XRE-family HTH domain
MRVGDVLERTAGDLAARCRDELGDGVPVEVRAGLLPRKERRRARSGHAHIVADRHEQGKQKVAARQVAANTTDRVGVVPSKSVSVVTLRSVMVAWVRERMRLGETHEEIAGRLGVDRGQVSQFLSGYVPKGQKRPRSFLAEHIDNAAASLDMTVGDFLATLAKLAFGMEAEERIRGVAAPPETTGGTARATLHPDVASRLKKKK